MLVKFKAVVSREPSPCKFNKDNIDINCYSSEDRIYIGVECNPGITDVGSVAEGDTLIITGNMKFNKSKDGSKTYYNVKCKALENLGSVQDLEF